MKYIFLLAVLSLAAPAAAREVLVDSFGSAPSADFLVLVPGDRPPINSVSLPHVSPEPEPELALAFSELNDPPPFQQISLPVIPSWMRVGRSSPDLPVRRFSTLRDPHCAGRDFFHRTNIGLDAQARRSAYFNLIVEAACDAGVPVRLFDALISQESRYRPFARSHVGAMGMAQLMPGTARYLRVTDPWDPVQNLRGGARYLREQLDRFGSWELALAAYNAGPGRVEQYRGIPPFRETQNYVRTIMASLYGRVLAPGVVSAPNPFRRVAFASFAQPLNVPEY